MKRGGALAAERFRRNVLTGLLTVVPLWITVWVMWFLLDQLVRIGRPFVLALAAAIRPYADELADVLVQGWFQSALAAILALGALYAIGASANAVIGRRIVRGVDRLMERLPLAKTIYGATRTLIESFRGGPQSGGNGSS